MEVQIPEGKGQFLRLSSPLKTIVILAAQQRLHAYIRDSYGRKAPGLSSIHVTATHGKPAETREWLMSRGSSKGVGKERGKTLCGGALKRFQGAND